MFDLYNWKLRICMVNPIDLFEESLTFGVLEAPVGCCERGGITERGAF